MTTTYWTASAGDDDLQATTHTSVTEAEQAAAARSLTTYHHTAYVRRAGGQRIREYRDGELVGYLSGSDETWVEVQ